MEQLPMGAAWENKRIHRGAKEPVKLIVKRVKYN